MASDLFYIFCAIYLSFLVYVFMQEPIDSSPFDRVYEMQQSELYSRKMRAYLCTKDSILYLRLTDSQPIGGFDEFPIGLAQFDIVDGKSMQMETNKGVMFGDERLFVDAAYSLKIIKATNSLMIIQKYMGKTKKMMQQTLELTRLMNESDISAADQAFKCFIPHSDKSQNIYNVIKANNEKSVWQTDKLHGLNVYDLDILMNDRGCWAWTNEKGQAMEATGVGSAGGDNYDYEYKLDGNLLIMQWTDIGTWITPKNKDCHHGSTLFMVIADDEAVATFTCSNGHTGSQMVMRRKRGKAFEKLKCPLVEEAKRHSDL